MTTLTEKQIIAKNPQIVENADLYSRTILEQYEYEQRVDAACNYKNRLEANTEKIGLNGGRKVLYVIESEKEIERLTAILSICTNYFTKKVLTTILETKKFTEKQIDIVIDYLIEDENALNSLSI